MLKGELNPVFCSFPISEPMLINYTTKDNAAAAPPDRAPMVLGFNFTLLAVAVLFVSLRLLVKGKHGRLAIEDALIVISTV